MRRVEWVLVERNAERTGHEGAMMLHLSLRAGDRR